MRRRKITLTIIFLVVCGIARPFAPPVFSQSAPARKTSAAQSPAAGGGKFALLVGVNNYADPRIRDLEGCENDVKLMRGLLTEVYDFGRAETKELLTSNPNAADQPTKKAILETFDRHLIENAKAYLKSRNLQPEKDAERGAAIVFYYSGHGSHLPDDDNRDETDGEDETIVPMDSDLKGANDIRDDEFAARFAELKKYTSNITFIFDSCHSGTVTRGSGERSLNRPFSAAAQRTRGGDMTLDENMDAPAADGYVTISGSLPNQKSQEDLLPDQSAINAGAVVNPPLRTNGFMTYYLVQTLREKPNATYREALARVCAAVRKKNADQTPQIEGDADRPAFGAAAAIAAKRRTIDVLTLTKQEKNVVLTINAGKIVGAFPGGAAIIYRRAADAEPLAVGTIIEPTDDFQATVLIADAGDITADARVALGTPFFGSSRKIVALDTTGDAKLADADRLMIDDLAQKLEKSSYVTARKMTNPLAAKNRKSWNLALVRSAWSKFNQDGNRQPSQADAPQDADEIYYLASTNDKPLYNFWVRAADARASEKIAAALEKFVRVDNLRSLGNDASELGKNLDFKIVRLKSLTDKPRSRKDFSENGFLASPSMTVGDYFSFEITNKTGVALFAYIYTVGTDGSVKMMYGPKNEGDGLLDNVTFKSFGANIVARAGAPAGVETYKLIAATRWFDGRLLESSALAGKRGASALESLLAQAVSNKRDSELVSFDLSGWTAINLDVEIREK